MNDWQAQCLYISSLPLVWHLLGNLFWGPWCAIGSHGDIHQLPSAPCYAGGQNRTVTWSWCPQSFKPGTKPIIRQAIVVILTHLIGGENVFVKRKRLITNLHVGWHWRANDTIAWTGFVSLSAAEADSVIVSSPCCLHLDFWPSYFKINLIFRFLLLMATVTYPWNAEFLREHNLNLLSESLWERAIHSLPDSPGPEH